MNNRIHNCTNPYQGSAKRVLCVCSAGLLRSPTAAVVINREHGHNTRAAGLSTEYALIPVDVVLLMWAQEIVCMNGQQQKAILKMMEYAGMETKEVINLNIPDEYGYMDEHLVELINLRYTG